MEKVAHYKSGNYYTVSCGNIFQSLPRSRPHVQSRCHTDGGSGRVLSFSLWTRFSFILMTKVWSCFVLFLYFLLTFPPPFPALPPTSVMLLRRFSCGLNRCWLSQLSTPLHISNNIPPPPPSSLSPPHPHPHPLAPLLTPSNSVECQKQQSSKINILAAASRVISFCLSLLSFSVYLSTLLLFLCLIRESLLSV